jgi:Fe-S oxidoreductase
VNLALLKAEMLHARWRRDGVPLRERILSKLDLIGKLGCLMPRLTNRFLDSKPVRVAMEKTIGISRHRSLPQYANERFDKWFAKRLGSAGASPAVFGAPPKTDARISEFEEIARLNVSREARDTAGEAPALPRRGKVILWDDTFVRYHEPHIGIAAVKVLEALGFEVSLLKKRRCCGRPAFSQGNLNAAAKLAKHNISQLSTLQPSLSYGSASNSELSIAPILFLEASCWSMFVEDYRELKIDNAENIAARCLLFEKFVHDLFAQEPDALRFRERTANVLIHPHCHAKSITSLGFMGKLAERVPGTKATVLDTACCGMAGAFGALAEKYDLSVQIAQRLLDQIDDQRRTLSGSTAGTEVIASGTSCRHQITDLTNAHPKHMAELLAEALV